MGETLTAANTSPPQPHTRTRTGAVLAVGQTVTIHIPKHRDHGRTGTIKDIFDARICLVCFPSEASDSTQNTTPAEAGTPCAKNSAWFWAHELH